MVDSAAHAHTITVSEPTERVRITLDGVTVADTHRARVLREGSLRPRYYIPREDVRIDLLVRTDSTTTCPFKGEASYWSLELDGRRYPDLVWSYEAPIPDRAEIAGLLCFYDEKVELDVG
jgi:uncharacterized protein (DUF427 family)